MTPDLQVSVPNGPRHVLVAWFIVVMGVAEWPCIVPEWKYHSLLFIQITVRKPYLRQIVNGRPIREHCAESKIKRNLDRHLII